MPKLSIITVNFNDKNGLIDTAKSVVAQTWTDYEWIIIDGGSTDGSVDVIKEYADKTDKLAYWCSESDGGIYQGMNKGIEKAKGKYCWFLNSGDYAYKNTSLEEIFMNNFDEDIIYGNVIYTQDVKTFNAKQMFYYAQKKYRGKLSLLYSLANGVPQHQATLIKRKLFDKYGSYNLNFRIIADRVFFMNVLFVNKVSYKYVPVVFAMHNCSGVSKQLGNKIKKREESKKMIALLFPNSFSRIVFTYLCALFAPFVKIKNATDKFLRYGLKDTFLYYLTKLNLFKV